MTAKQTWDSHSYQRDTGFVAKYGEDVLSWLKPQSGERILDLGCGDGVLTKQIMSSDALVVGVDASESFVISARASGINAHVVDAHALEFDSEFDAVFSNAALHWMLEPEKVVEGVKRALKPGGRFVAEFGGFGNVAAVTTAMKAVGVQMDGDLSLASPWFFPTVNQYAGILTDHGFRVDDITSFYRPTVLPNGMRSWLQVMRAPFFEQYGTRADEAYEKVEAALIPTLCDNNGQWIADYVRLRFAARLM